MTNLLKRTFWAIFLCNAILSAPSHANQPDEPSGWFIDLGWKTQRIIDSTTALLGVRLGLVQEPFVIGVGVFALPHAIKTESSKGYQKQLTYKWIGVYGEYRYKLVHWLSLSPNLLVMCGAGYNETRRLDVVDRTTVGGCIAESAVNAQVEFMRGRIFSVGGGYAAAKSDRVGNGLTANAAFRVEW